ncbi:MAG: bifunctional (p)ppGpp synthetase/guanosine-3',5'-bis(diphosphate) 3'-pyrophosphohydrolase [Actinomycetota bacterium]|nr:bifunctional (p)ppGpp synthetase/guanosine-3',5'-bis(diphosphate) 3'-pyrophosphohydrolase [Actinomycetota bacterium]
MDSKEDLQLETPPSPPPQKRSGRLPIPRLRRGGTAPPAGLPTLLKNVRSYNPKGDLHGLEDAYRVAEEAHQGQARKSGEPFIEHPLAVAEILADLRLDTTTLAAALLHDTVEDTEITLTRIQEEFGEDVARIVDGLTKLDRLEFRTRELAQAENVRKMIVAMAGDIRVLLIKLADRLHNMRTVEPLSPGKQRRMATETLEIYAPLANRLGVQEVKWELEDLSFKTLHPGPYKEIARLVEARRDERRALIDELTGSIRQKLKELGVKADVEGRPKHLYSIYEKMVIRGKEFEEIYDLVGIRILAGSLRDCYAALGAVHSLWKPIPGRFKDYVAMPKSNMYQSLHTTVVGPNGTPLEIQIRTRDMHRTAQYGIAAHWRYKEGGKQSKDTADLAWLGQMMDWLKDMADPREFMEGLRIDLSGGRVFVFTPKGDVINLPQGATPVDFSYAIHTEVGHRTIGAKVNGKLVPLDYELRTGDSVDVLTSKAQGEGPSQDWLQFVATPRARNKIRQWFARGRREDALDQGKDLLQRQMRKQNLSFKRLTTEEALEQVATDLKQPDLDALYVAVGEGHVSPQSVVARLSRQLSGSSEEEVTDVPLARPVHIAQPEVAKGVMVKGLGDVWVRLGRCCTPVPGDQIVGFVTRGQGVSVHRADCPNVKTLRREPERMIEVSWAEGKSTSFVVAIQVEALDRTRLLSDIATMLSDQHVNILSANSSTGRDRITRLRFSFELADITHLSSLLASVKRVENVYDAYRVVPS